MQLNNVKYYYKDFGHKIMLGIKKDLNKKIITSRVTHTRLVKYLDFYNSSEHPQFFVSIEH